MRLSGQAGGFPRESLLRIAAEDIRASACEVTGSTGYGIIIETATDVQINDCNIHGNALAGLRNESDTPVDAANNWWGDPEGPLAPAGDGVEGAVDYEPWRTEPVGL